MDEPKREHELSDDPLVEETPGEVKAAVFQDQQAPGEVDTQSEVAAAEDEQIELQAASAGLRGAAEDQDEAVDVPEPEQRPDFMMKGALFQDDQREDLRTQWLDVQSSFVEDPRDSVEAADKLIDKLVDDIRSNLAVRRSSLQLQMKNGDGDGSNTEELRQALKTYRLLFDRLLEIEI
jgi:hypothetical protein